MRHKYQIAALAPDDWATRAGLNDTHAVDTQPTGGGGDHRIGEYRKAAGLRLRRQLFLGGCAGINNGGDLDAGRSHIARRAIGAFMAGNDHRPGSRFDAEPVQIRTGGTRQHDAGAVVAGEDQRPLDCAGGEYDLASPNMPQPLPGPWGIAIGDAFDQAHHIVAEEAEGRCPPQQRHRPARGQARNRFLHPCPSICAHHPGAGFGEQ